MCTLLKFNTRCEFFIPVLLTALSLSLQSILRILHRNKAFSTHSSVQSDNGACIGRSYSQWSSWRHWRSAMLRDACTISAAGAIVSFDNILYNHLLSRSSSITICTAWSMCTCAREPLESAPCKNSAKDQQSIMFLCRSAIGGRQNCSAFNLRRPCDTCFQESRRSHDIRHCACADHMRART